MSDSDSAKCGPYGSSVSSFGSCSSYTSSTTYTPYPTYSSTSGSCTGTSEPACTAVTNCRWVQGSSANSSYCYYSSSATYSPNTTYSSSPYPTYSSTPYPTTEATTTTYTPPTTTYTPPATTYSPPPAESTTTTIPPSGFDSKAHQMAVARTIMACADFGGSWNAGTASCKPANSGFFANVLKVFSKFLRP